MRTWRELQTIVKGFFCISCSTGQPRLQKISFKGIFMTRQSLGWFRFQHSFACWNLPLHFLHFLCLKSLFFLQALKHNSVTIFFSQQLKANMRELENTRLQIKNEDISAFELKIAPIKKQAVEAINSFGNLQADLVQRMESNHIANSPGGYSFHTQNHLNPHLYFYFLNFVFRDKVTTIPVLVS